VPLCPPQIPHGLTRARTRASAVRGRRLTNDLSHGTACQKMYSRVTCLQLKLITSEVLHRKCLIPTVCSENQSKLSEISGSNELMDNINIDITEIGCNYRRWNWLEIVCNGDVSPVSTAAVLLCCFSLLSFLKGKCRLMTSPSCLCVCLPYQLLKQLVYFNEIQ
jgi:hypothetical protein